VLFLVHRLCHPDEGGAKFLRNIGFLEEPHCVTSQKIPFFIVTAEKTSNLTCKLQSTSPSPSTCSTPISHRREPPSTATHATIPAQNPFQSTRYPLKHRIPPHLESTLVAARPANQRLLFSYLLCSRCLAVGLYATACETYYYRDSELLLSLSISNNKLYLKM
jgi:hypothetical protein